MQEITKIIIGIAILLLGIPVGSYLAEKTKDELKAGQKWFKLIIIISLACSVISLIAGNDFLFFSFLFIAMVTSRSLLSKKIKRNK
jgi:formate hydrogenlyase subunit 3/multisubunit Na+/H+ antiporter MnhD subunit